MSDLAAIKLAIRNELHATGCTQADLARHLGVSPVSVSRILTGRRQGSHALVEAMAHAVGLTLETGRHRDDRAAKAASA